MSVAVVCFGFLNAIQAEVPERGGGSIDSLTEPGQGLTIRTTSPGTGRPTFASTRGQGILLQVSPGASAEARGNAFIDTYGKAFGLQNASQMRLQRAPHKDELGIEHVRYQQVHHGVPITGAEFQVHMKGARVLAANGLVMEDLPLDVQPWISAGQAREAAQRLIEKRRPAVAAGARYSEPRLEILNRTLLSKIGNDRSRLAWFVEATGDELRQYIWIDARAGAILMNFSQLTDAKNRTIYTANNTNTLPGTLVRTEGGAATGDADNDNAYLYAGVTYDYFLNNHGRDSYDGLGAEMRSTTHYCDPPDCPNYPNAFWNGTQMVYGNGYASADDVVAHELTHAVTERSAGLFYYMQSGALNESFSDMFGEAVDLSSSVGSGDDSAGARWLMGEDLSIGAIRDMMFPNLFSNPNRVSDLTYFVCSTSAWTDPNADQGGVHSNSGVPNHAFALMVDGGTFNGRTITAIGLQKTAKIHYRALTNYLTSGSGFIDHYNAVNESCNDLIGTIGITAANCTQVTLALQAVEMNLPWGCLGAIQTPAQCTSGVPSFFHVSGFEGGLGNWTATNTAAGGWLADTGMARRGTGMAYGNDPEGISTHRLTMTNALTIPTGGRMYFDQLFEFENDAFGNYDGGIFEYSTNNGVNWSSANPLIDAGHVYDGILETSNPLGAISAYVGSSYGYTGTRLNLSSLAGQNVKFRFSIGTDAFVSSLGWLLDNISFYTCVSAAFTDDPLVAGTHLVKAVHITELRARINSLRLAHDLSLILFTAVSPGTPITAAQVTQLRTALAAAYTASGRTAPVYTDPVLTAGMPIKAVHIQQLRAAVLALE